MFGKLGKVGIWLPLTLVGGLLSGCATQGAAPGVSDPSDEILRLKRQIVELQRESRVHEVENARLLQRVDQLRNQLAEAPDCSAVSTSPDTSLPTAEPYPERAASIEPPASPPPVTVPEAVIEESDLEEVEMLPPPSQVVLPEATPQPVIESDPVDAEAQRLYDVAYTFFHQKDYAEAERQFQGYLDRYPRTDLSDNALFWIGESRYARGQYDTALTAFSETVARFPAGNKVADAMLKAGKCLEELGDPEAARETYREVIERFPSLSAAEVARKHLTALP